LAFFVSRGTGRPCATAGRLGTVGAHTGAGGQCADAIKTGVGTDGPARILHTGSLRKAGPWAGKKQNEVAYIMPDWAGRMASIFIVCMVSTVVLR